MATNASSQMVAKLWSYCNVLRDDGLSYGDYVEQLTYLLFLKMAHERTQPPYSQPSTVPVEYAWPALMATDNLPEPDVIAREIVEDLRAALEQFEGVAAELGERDG